MCVPAAQGAVGENFNDMKCGYCRRCWSIVVDCAFRILCSKQRISSVCPLQSIRRHLGAVGEVEVKKPKKTESTYWVQCGSRNRRRGWWLWGVALKVEKFTHSRTRVKHLFVVERTPGCLLVWERNSVQSEAATRATTTQVAAQQHTG